MQITPAREPNGRPQREVQTMPAEAKRLRDAALRGMQAPEWGTELGRLFLERKVPAEEFEAGKRYAQVTRDYRRALGITEVEIKGQDPNRSRGNPPDADSEAGRALTKAEQAAVARMHAAELAIRETGGRNVFRTVHRICVDDECAVGLLDLRNLSTGLQALAAHFGLTAAHERGKRNVR